VFTVKVNIAIDKTDGVWPKYFDVIFPMKDEFGYDLFDVDLGLS